MISNDLLPPSEECSSLQDWNQNKQLWNSSVTEDEIAYVSMIQEVV